MSVRFPIAASVAATFLAGIPACDCGVAPLAAPPGRLTGTVCDVDTGEPIAGGTAVTIEAGTQSFTAPLGELGVFFADNIPAGDVVVVLPGDRRVEAEVEPDATTTFIDTACRDIAGEHPGSIDGRVCNAHVGDVVVGADVVLVLPDGTQLTTTTDAEGRFSFAEVPQGTHAVSIRGDGYQKSVIVTVGPDEEVVVDVGNACAIPSPGETGDITGLVCAADFGGLVDASVTVTTDGGIEVTTTTDSEGRFVLEGVPAGEQTIVIVKGSFRQTITVTVVAGEVLALDENECALEPDDIRVAFVTGSRNDHMRDVLGSLGIEDSFIDVYNGKHGSDAEGGPDGDWALQLLSSDARINDYDVVFISCRAIEDDLRASSAMRNVLRDFVLNGGSVYTSDQAYGIIEAVWPEQIDFYGDDDTARAANKGEATDDVNARIVDANLAASFGGTSASLHYPLNGWSVVEDVASGVKVYADADVELTGTLGRVRGAPQMVGFKHGAGTVIYSSFHQEPGTHPDQLRMLQILMFEL